MIKKCILIISMVLLIAPAYLQAQSFTPEVIGSAGGYTYSASGSMSWTIGEIITETDSSTGVFFTQGFQQPDSIIVTGISQLNDISISVYPNPVVSNLIISIPESSGNYSIEMYDMQGQLLQRQNVESAAEKSLSIPLSGYANGIYLLNIINTKTNHKSSYKINKVN